LSSQDSGSKSIPIDEILQKDAFRNMDPSVKEGLRKLTAQTQGKSTAECVPLLLQFFNQLPKGKSLSSAEQQAMIEAVLESLPDNEKAKFQNLVKMAQMFSHNR